MFVRRYTYVGVGAAVIATIALTASILDGCANRKHQRLSVRPELTLQSTVNHTGFLGSMVVNKGFGPAKVQKLSVWIDGHLILPDDGHWGLTKAATHYGLKDIISYTTFSPKAIIKQDESAVLWMLPEENRTEENSTTFQKCFESLKIIIECESLYGEVDSAVFELKFVVFGINQIPGSQQKH